jgi:hypothetical protein
VSEASPRVPVSRTASGQVAKTFATWVVMMVLFGVIYGWSKQALGRGPMLALIAVAAAIVGLLVWRAARELRRFWPAHIEAVRQIACGKHVEAREAMWGWSERARSARIAAIARHSLGWTMMRQGELDDAEAVLADNEAEYLQALTMTGIAATSAADLALVHGLRGDSDQARVWLEIAEDRRGKSLTSTIGAMIAFSRAVWLCRTGRVDEAAKHLDEGWAEYEATFTGDALRPLRVVRAFAHAAAGPRAGGVALAALPTLRPAYPGEYTFLGVRWPEMAEFLATHELAG